MFVDSDDLIGLKKRLSSGFVDREELIAAKSPSFGAFTRP